ncbi:FIST N-terminal domain-containing protein [Desulfobacterales bacterium HSG17]|nr:FIST N-terminal domain-containing protein [Desulfobacterales bacterium HSG17]
MYHRKQILTRSRSWQEYQLPFDQAKFALNLPNKRIKMFFGISTCSEDIDAESAFEEIQEQCEEKLDGQTPKAGLLFAGIDTEHQKLVDAINQTWPGIQLIGCSSDAELSSTNGFCEDSVTLMLFGSDTIDITAGVGRNLSRDIPAACRQARDEALSKTDINPAFCITTPESLTTNGQQVITYLKGILGSNLPFFGATAGDQYRFKRTYQYYCNEVLSDAVPLLFFSGSMNFAAGVASGWLPVGAPGEVTRAEGTVVYEIDHFPAIDFYKRFLGADAKPSGECPLAILGADNEMEYLRATPGTVDETTGAITFFADVPQNAKVQVTVADREGILTGCRDSVEMALANYPGDQKPEAGIFFSCTARKILLGTQTRKEHEILMDKFGDDFQLIGFYGYGEIGPNLTGQSDSKFHMESFVSLLIGT